MSVWKIPFVVLMVMAVTACGPSQEEQAQTASDSGQDTAENNDEPVVDTSSEAAQIKSLERVRSSLPEEQRIEFDQSVKLIMDMEPGRLNGMSAAQVLAAGRRLHQRINAD